MFFDYFKLTSPHQSHSSFVLPPGPFLVSSEGKYSSAGEFIAIR